ncbi:DUF397 domain-containing protein [Streptomyces erythrochromogenes]|uniref:DUF397 domain-containing protein n=1 Tax=Streptomyces erythrochromogenes TaxID=285574 RepID=UPI00369DC918
MSIKPSAGGLSALEWAKSSYSASDSNECIEVAWTKSSYSTNGGPNCIEVAHTPGTVLVRDSKRPEGARLAVTPDAWTGFVAHATA